MADNAMKLIYSLTLSADSSGVTITNIPQDYTDLYMEMTLRDTGGSINFRLNGDSGSTNYQRVNFYGIARNAANTTSNIVASGRGTNESAMFLTAGDDDFSMNWYHLLGYSSPNVTKVLFEDNGFVKPLGGAIGQWNYLWKNSAPVTSIVITSSGSNTWKAGSTFNIYGIKCATPSAKATGGDNMFTDGAFWYHTFTTSGVLNVRTAMSVDYLVVGGGGGGGFNWGGGGGAGGLRSTVTATGGGGSLESTLSVVPSQYTVTVGAGGAGGVAAATDSNNGSNSTFSTITSIGGGKAGSGAAASFASSIGGSGGGGGRGNTNTGSAGTSGQGFTGGNADSPVQYGAGGGGGAGQAGFNTNSGSGNGGSGNGGAGVAVSISGGSVTYAGGGGGGGLSSQTRLAGSGGAGGGGAGAYTNDTNGVAGTINTGSGGGGGAGGSPGGAGGAGGSGLVIVRYPV